MNGSVMADARQRYEICDAEAWERQAAGVEAEADRLESNARALREQAKSMRLLAQQARGRAAHPTGVA